MLHHSWCFVVQRTKWWGPPQLTQTLLSQCIMVVFKNTVFLYRVVFILRFKLVNSDTWWCFHPTSSTSFQLFPVASIVSIVWAFVLTVFCLTIALNLWACWQHVDVELTWGLHIVDTVLTLCWLSWNDVYISLILCWHWFYLGLTQCQHSM